MGARLAVGGAKKAQPATSSLVGRKDDSSRHRIRSPMQGMEQVAFMGSGGCSPVALTRGADLPHMR